MSFFNELKRRNVFRVAIAYAIASWLLIEVSSTTFPMLRLPEWGATMVTVLLLIGLPIALIFAWAFELTPGGIKKEKDVDRSESITHVTGRKLDFTIIGVLAIAVGFLLTDKFILGESPEAGVGEIIASGQSIAVLPFVNISSDKEQEYFSDGITEEILNSLASVKELKVAGRTSSFAFKGENQDLRRIGDLLGVEHILEGSVRKAGTTVRITAQLVQVEDGFHLWSDTYDRELTDVFAIQDEIANEILNQLKARLLGEEQQVIVSQRTDPEVYDLYLLAKQRLYHRTRQTIESAVGLLDQAIAKDPEYAPAYSQRGIATLLLAEGQYGTLPKAESDVQAKRFIDEALDKDAQLAEAWAGLGLYHINRPAEHEQAIEALSKALSLNPNLINASHWLQLALGNSGEPRAGLQILEHMMQRDPLYRPGFFSGVLRLNDFGQEDKAQALLDTFRGYNPNSPVLLSAEAAHHLYNGRAAEAVRLAERARELEPENGVTHFWLTIGMIETHQIERIAEEGFDSFAKVQALNRLGRRDEASELAIELVSELGPGPLFDQYNRSGRSKELVDYLEERWPSLSSFAADNPHNRFGYNVMAAIAFAYSRTGNAERFDEALMLVENAMSKVGDQGIDNFVFFIENAKYLALAGEYEDAVSQLEQAVERGWLGIVPIAANQPIFEPLQDNPRFIAVEAMLVENINIQREALGLESIDPLSRL